LNIEEMLEKLDKGLDVRVKVRHMTFTGKCPTYSKVAAIITNSAVGKVDELADAKIAAMTVTGWEGVTEADIFPDDGDSTVLVPFDPMLFEKIIYDKGEWWKAISSKVTESVMKRQAIKDDSIKNSQAGTTAKQ